MALDTHPYRVWGVQYVAMHGLDQDVPDEEGFDPTLHGPLGPPGQRFFKRIARNMIAVNAEAKAAHKHQPYPGVQENGILDAPMRAALTPDRPGWQDEFKRIARQDDKLDGEEYYTMGPKRWQGVQAILGKTKVSMTIPRLTGGDCSSGYTRWVLWGLQQHLGRVPHDVVNGCSWTAGYTGTIQLVCQRVQTPQIGDAILYPNHVTGVYDVAARTCISHGRERAEIVGWDSHFGRIGFWRPNISKA